MVIWKSLLWDLSWFEVNEQKNRPFFISNWNEKRKLSNIPKTVDGFLH